MTENEQCSQKSGHGRQCQCHHPGRGSLLQGFIQPALLLLLIESPAHGYDLANRLDDFGLADSDPGGIYRTLQKLEGDGFIESSWDTSGSGPARKVYEVTTEGHEFLNTWVAALKRNREFLTQFIQRYDKQQDRELN